MEIRNPVRPSKEECPRPLRPREDEEILDDPILAKTQLPIFKEVSSRVWRSLNYSGLPRPWFENWEALYENVKKIQLCSLSKLIQKLNRLDLDIQSYARLVSLAASRNDWERVSKLFFQFKYVSWVHKLQNNCKLVGLSLEELLDCFGLVLNKQQVEHGAILLGPMIGKIGDVYGFTLLTEFITEVCKARKSGIDFETWLDLKLENYYKKWGNKDLWFVRNLMKSYLDPSKKQINEKLSKSRELSSNPWGDIIEFLDLDPKVRFEEGHIPKGFQIATYHLNQKGKMSDITMIGSCGYYYVQDGSRYRADYHYMGNNYLVIGVTPENFHLFKDDWYTNRKNQIPTWEEMFNHGVSKDAWKEDGTSIKPFLKKVKWRNGV